MSFILVFEKSDRTPELQISSVSITQETAALLTPADAKLLTKTLENDTNLVWQPSPDGRAASYEVIYRDTTAPNWEKTFPVGAATKATIPASKDNGIFAVRAVDAEGHRSLPSLPMPER